MLKHTVKVNLADRKGNKQELLKSTSLRLPQRLLKLFFGNFDEILILKLGKSVEGIVIQEVPQNLKEKGK
jgi:hypothetical protein